MKICVLHIVVFWEWLDNQLRLTSNETLFTFWHSSETASKPESARAFCALLVVSTGSCWGKVKTVTPPVWRNEQHRSESGSEGLTPCKGCQKCSLCKTVWDEILGGRTAWATDQPWVPTLLFGSFLSVGHFDAEGQRGKKLLYHTLLSWEKHILTVKGSQDWEHKIVKMCFPQATSHWHRSFCFCNQFLSWTMHRTFNVPWAPVILALKGN